MSIEIIKHKLPTHRSKFIVTLPILSEIVAYENGFIIFGYWDRHKDKVETRYFSVFKGTNPFEDTYDTENSFEKDGEIWYVCEEPTKTIICTN